MLIFAFELSIQQYGAHSTATDSLFAGLPVLTLVGDAFASRVCASLLRNVAMDELVVYSKKEYEDLAVALALESGFALAKIRGKLVEDGHEQPLFQTQQYTRSLEEAYRLMYDVHIGTGSPHHILL